MFVMCFFFISRGYFFLRNYIPFHYDEIFKILGILLLIMNYRWFYVW